MDPDVWLRPHGEHDHMSVYVDDVLISSKDFKSVIDVLTKNNL